MENRIKKKVTNYINTFKDDVIKQLSNSNESHESFEHFLCSYISNYARLSWIDDDFSKRKRIKNHVPEYDRCGARRADGCQCTRRKKGTNTYCGTHLKGIPHGEVQQETITQYKKIELTVIPDSRGISHYVDNSGKQYPAEMVLNADTNI